MGSSHGIFECCKNVSIDRHATHLFNAGIKFFAEALGVEVPEDDPAEDGGDGGVGEQVDVQRVEVANEATWVRCEPAHSINKSLT